MPRTGRPPKPVEQHKRTGTYRPDRHAKTDVVVLLPMSEDVPEPPADLGLEGRDLWAKVWAEAITWLSEDSDWTAMVDACRAADDLSIARRRYAATSDPGDGRVVATLRKSLAEALSALGFTPTARSRLGVAEVKKATALEQLLATRAKTR